MNYNYQNKNIKRSGDDCNTTSNDRKKFKCERDVKVPESANDRLQRLRNSLANPHFDQTDPEPIGWKPQTAIQTLKVNKPQVVAKRQFLQAVRKISQTNLSQDEKKIQAHNGKSHKSFSKNLANDSSSQLQQSSIRDRLILSKSTSPYSLELYRRRKKLVSAIDSSDIDHDHDFHSPIQNASTVYTNNSMISNSNKKQSENKYEEKQSTQLRSSVNKLEHQKTVDTIASNINHCFEILEKSKNDFSFKESGNSKCTNAVDRLNNSITNVAANNNSLSNLTSTETNNTERYQNRSPRKLSERTSLPPSCSQHFVDKSTSKSIVTNHANNTSLFNNSINGNLNFNDSQSQIRISTEERKLYSQKICDTKSLDNVSCNENTSPIIIQKLNPNGSESQSNETRERRSIFNRDSLTPIANSTIHSNPIPRKISVQDRLKISVLSKNNNCTRPNSTTNIGTQAIDIFNTLRNIDDTESEAMEWSDIDMIEVIENVEQMRKVRKYPPETETELQHMLNANNTFAEKYQNPREDCNERDYYIVVDTNVFLSKLGIIKEILSIILKDNKKLYVYIPWMVIQELDYFKDGRCSSAKLHTNARRAITLLNECLGAKGSHLKAQLVTDALEAKSISKEPDDIILACCLQAKERNHIVILLSNDKNLRNKAIINNLSAYSTDDILEKLKSNKDKSGLQIDVEQIELRTSILLSVVIDECLREAYGDIINQMAIKKPPFSLFYALELMRKYWISVFSSVLQKQCLNTIDKLYDLMRQKGYTGLPDSDDKEKFTDLTLSLCVFLKTSFPQHSDNINTLVAYIKNSTDR